MLDFEICVIANKPNQDHIANPDVFGARMSNVWRVCVALQLNPIAREISTILCICLITTMIDYREGGGWERAGETTAPRGRLLYRCQ